MPSVSKKLVTNPTAVRAGEGRPGWLDMSSSDPSPADPSPSDPSPSDPSPAAADVGGLSPEGRGADPKLRFLAISRAHRAENTAPKPPRAMSKRVRRPNIRAWYTGSSWEAPSRFARWKVGAGAQYFREP